jgi:1-acyl-sn-glycerol-3-phosphate acyltransferase
MIRDLVAFMMRLVTGVRMLHEHAAPDRPRIYFANHSSHLDFVVIWAALPSRLRHRARPVAGADYWNRDRLRRWLATRVFRAVLIPRGKVSREDDPVGRMIAEMDLGHDLIIFPEGTRSPDGRIADFKPGIFTLARHYPLAELIPVHLENLNHILPKGEILPVPVMGNAIFGKTCEGPREGEPRHDFLVRARESLLALSTGPYGDDITRPSAQSGPKPDDPENK